jgi:hypothetical protein
MSTKTILKNAALRIMDHYREASYHINEAELLSSLQIDSSDIISEHCLYLNRVMVNNGLEYRHIDSPEIQYLISEIYKRFKLFNTTSDDELREALKEFEDVYYATRESVTAQMLELRNIHKDLEHQRNLYLSKCGLFELQIREKHIQIRLYGNAISLKEDNEARLSDEDLLEKASTKLEKDTTELENARKELFAKRSIFIRLQGNKKSGDHIILDESEYGEILRRRKNYLKRATPFLALEESQREKLSPLQQKKLTELQQAFVEQIKDEQALYDRYSIYASETSNYELENLLFKAEQLFASAGIDLPDNIIIYDCDTIEDMIHKLEKSIELFKYEIDQLKEKQRILHEDDEYLKYLSVNNLSDSETLSLHDQYKSNLDELDEQLSELKAIFTNM